MTPVTPNVNVNDRVGIEGGSIVGAVEVEVEGRGREEVGREEGKEMRLVGRKWEGRGEGRRWEGGGEGKGRCGKDRGGKDRGGRERRG